MTVDQSPGVLDRRDLLVGTAMAAAMTAAFMSLSSGASLLVTFVPGAAVAWLVLLWLYRSRAALPSAADFVPAFFLTLAIQLLHFAEEYLTWISRT